MWSAKPKARMSDFLQCDFCIFERPKTYFNNLSFFKWKCWKLCRIPSGSNYPTKSLFMAVSVKRGWKWDFKELGSCKNLHMANATLFKDSSAVTIVIDGPLLSRIVSKGLLKVYLPVRRGWRIFDAVLLQSLVIGLNGALVVDGG